MAREYLTALKESLEKKEKVLDEIYRLCILQQELLSEEHPDYEAFDRYVDDKDVCLEKLEKLDEGFESIYNKVSAEIQENRTLYADEIKGMQQLIRGITEKSASIQALEARNRQSIEQHFAKDRRQAKEQKRSVNVAMNYYRNMNGMVGADTSMKWDSKK